MKKYDVATICNALVDILVQVKDTDLTELQLTKGVMHLVDYPRQKMVLGRFKDHTKTYELGGSALNAMRTLAGLGAKTFFAGMIGEDEFGNQIRSRMRELKIDSDLQHHEESTGSCVVLISPDGERTMNTHLGASRLFDEKLVPEEAIANSKIFHFCGYQWDTPEQKRAIGKAIACAKENNTKVSFDVADPFVVDRNRANFMDIIDQADVVFANQEEARLLYNTSPEESVDRIVNQGAIAVIKLGAKGALIANKTERHVIGPVKTTVVDTTAAGDMFAAGFLYGLSNGIGLRKSGEIAAILASDVISRIGATVSSSALDRARL